MKKPFFQKTAILLLSSLATQFASAAISINSVTRSASHFHQIGTASTGIDDPGSVTILANTGTSSNTQGLFNANSINVNHMSYVSDSFISSSTTFDLSPPASWDEANHERKIVNMIVDFTVTIPQTYYLNYSDNAGPAVNYGYSDKHTFKIENSSGSVIYSKVNDNPTDNYAESITGELSAGDYTLTFTAKAYSDIWLGVADFAVNTSITFEPSPVPLPAAAWLFGSALIGLGLRKFH